MSSNKQIYRFLMVLPRGERKVFLAWRLLPQDAPNTPFYVERRRGEESWKRINDKPIIA